MHGFAAPLLEVFQKIGQLLKLAKAAVRGPATLLRHLSGGMGELREYLIYSNPSKIVICENLNIYMEKNEEEFQEYLGQFAKDMWSLLMTVSLSPSHDRLATTAIKFLTTVSKSVHHTLFANPTTLRQICEGIIIPNVRLCDEDENLFETNHLEYIRRDIEGRDLDPRRRAACELIKGLSTHYREQVAGLLATYINEMLKGYAANPEQNWKAKYCAMYWVVSLATRQSGEGSVGSDLVNVEHFFTTQVVPELQGRDIDSQPLLTTGALKFLSTFHSQVPKSLALGLLMRFLVAENNVVHSYAARCIEKLLTIKDGKRLRYSAADVDPVLEQLLTNLFAALTLPESQENTYVMKCIVRVVNLAELRQHTYFCLAKLVNILMEVCKNPTNSSFHHYLFEAVAALVRRSCGTDSQQVAPFESELLPVVEIILREDVTEFAAYALQILAQLIECRGPPLDGAYIRNFSDFLTPFLWQRSANVPALVRLLQAYLQNAPEEFNQPSSLNPVLGVFETLVASTSTDHQGCFILSTIVENLSYQAFAQYLPQIWCTLFSRIQRQPTVKFIKSLIIFMSLFAVKHGHERLTDSINSVQPDLVLDILENVWVPNLTYITGNPEIKLCVVAVTKLLTESPVMLSDTAQVSWEKLLNGVVTLLVRPEEDRAEEETDMIPDLDEVVGYTTTFAQLHNAGKKEEDHVKDVRDSKEYLATSLERLSAQFPSRFGSIVQQAIRWR